MGNMRDSGLNGALVAQGLVAGTRVATRSGWQAVEGLRRGDAVQTFEAGLQPIAGLRSARVSAADVPEALWAVFVPRDALDNREDLQLLPMQRVLIEADCVQDLHGDRFALIPAAALDGWRGIRRRRPRAGTEVLHLTFEVPQIIYASRATMIACAADAPDHDMTPALMAGRADRADYAALSLPQAQHLIACLMAEDLGAALWGRPGANPTARF